MTVKELIEDLKHFNEDMIVIVPTTEEYYEPFPHTVRHEFKTTYWGDSHKLLDIPANVEYLEL